MRLIYNDALNKRIAPYLERLTKKRTGLDKETMTLLDVFMQYFNMDTRYGTYSDKLEPCIIHIIQEEKIKSVANLFDGKLNKVLHYLLGDEYASLFHTYLKLKARCPYTHGYSRRSQRSANPLLHFNHIIDALTDTVMEYFHITEAQLEEFTASFVQRLPKYMQDALERRETAA